MLKSLFSGVSGLQSHQVAMDVESNNIANVNTVGYKYSRANFSDLLAQTKAIATAPQGSLGGKNAVQVGLGSTISSMTRIFSQGSVQNSDKNTDVAIQGDGFFIVSPDGGNTYKYTRAGDFKFDAGGNFVDNNGFVTQGWLRDKTTGKVDSTAPIVNINIPPGLTTPAQPSTEVVVKANLNSGPLVESFSAAYAVASSSTTTYPPVATTATDSNGNAIASGNVGVMFNETGESFALQNGQGVWASFRTTQHTATVATTAGNAQDLDLTFTLDDGSTQIVKITSPTTTPTAQTATQNAQTFAGAINAQSAITGVQATVRITGGVAYIDLSNDNGLATASHNIRVTKNAGDASGITSGSPTTAYKYTYDSASTASTAGADKKFTTIADLRYAMEVEARNNNGLTPDVSVFSTVLATGGTGAVNDFLNIDVAGINVTANVFEEHAVTFGLLAAGDTLTVGGLELTAGVGGMTATQVSEAFDNLAAGTTSVTAPIPTGGTFTAGTLTGYASTGSVATGGVVSFTSSTANTDVADISIAINDAGTGTGVIATAAIVFQTQDELGILYANTINAASIPGVTASYAGGTLTFSNASSSVATVVVNNVGKSAITGASIPAATQDANFDNAISIEVDAKGKFLIQNSGTGPDDYDVNLKITAFSSTALNITENVRFTRNLEAMNAVLATGSTGKAFSQSFNAATHSSSIDIFDSLGSKHTLRTEFRKTALDVTTGSTWDMTITVPQPATIDTLAPTYEKTGSIRFNNDGSLATYNPATLSFSGNNGSAPDQQVNLSFGTANAFDGMTSFDSVSSTSGISQDGFTGGDLVGIRIDQSGTLIGSFSNGRSFGLAQIGMAKFTNNEGLGTEGGNIFVQSANSGDPIIGTAATSGRGFIQSSALEASNVDLSRALTQLIIIQRGFQANGKTITTSDQLLQTLIGLKN
ncbi:flagellar hook protein FlgE [Sulfurimonas sp. SAG-AH-194-I05]|nr:flagellar hook-basal body complex protein [Sulfurimonas sp. SAG-AH-194-I05]MDF1875370.1 flagellar hook protein FlgE [Sulfurimonas sp. SAG-AH-194-I05]